MGVLPGAMLTDGVILISGSSLDPDGPKVSGKRTLLRANEETEFDGDRYAYDIDVEAVQAIPSYTEDIRKIVVSGIPVYKTSDFETVENLLLEEGATMSNGSDPAAVLAALERAQDGV